MTLRVQIPAYTDNWMRGARFGEIVGRRVKPVSTGSANAFVGQAQIKVKLDAMPKAKPQWYIEEDCEVVS